VLILRFLLKVDWIKRNFIMIFERSLLGRIEHAEGEIKYSANLDEAMLVDSVLEHVLKLLNVRQGSVETVPGYGLPDFNDLVRQYPFAINEIRREIKICIEKYEPRLTKIKVEHVQDEDDPLSLRYDISACLCVDSHKDKSISNIWFETIMDAAGKVSIRG